MKAQIITGQAPGGQRQRLADILPLRTPLLVEIFPIYACNFRCKYCAMSQDKSKRGFISDKVVMDFNLYKRCVDDLSSFPDKVKVVRFSGLGEPLLHNEIAEMIGYAKGKVERTEILTNGSMLTHQMSDDLISAGLTRLFVSIQGTSQKKYREVSDVKINFDRFIGNLRYYFEHKKSGQLVHIKIIDLGLDGKADEQKFYDIFGDVCDTIGIEYVGAIQPAVDYTDIVKDKALTQYGLPISKVNVCPQPFFRLQINPDGKVTPCYAHIYPAFIGDATKWSIVDIWNGALFQQFRRKMLDGIDNANPVCAKCEIIRHRVFPEDDLSNDVERLKKIYETI